MQEYSCVRYTSVLQPCQVTFLLVFFPKATMLPFYSERTCTPEICHPDLYLEMKSTQTHLTPGQLAILKQPYFKTTLQFVVEKRSVKNAITAYSEKPIATSTELDEELLLCSCQLHAVSVYPIAHAQQPSQVQHLYIFLVQIIGLHGVSLQSINSRAGNEAKLPSCQVQRL